MAASAQKHGINFVYLRRKFSLSLKYGSVWIYQRPSTHPHQYSFPIEDTGGHAKMTLRVTTFDPETATRLYTCNKGSIAYTLSHL